MTRGWLLAVLLAACGETPATSIAPVTSIAPAAAPAPSPSPSPAPSPSLSLSLSPSLSPLAPPPGADVVAAYAATPPTLDGDLSDPVWARAPATAITTDYAGTTIPSPTTSVRLAWTDDALFVAFDCSFDPPLTAPDAPPVPEYEHVYGYDVVEIFVDADPSTPHTYREIELGPRSHTLDVAVDLDARPHGDVAWSSGTTHAEHVDEAAHRFTIEARIPLAALDVATMPPQLHVGLFRITSHSPSPRVFLARFPTLTARPNFHVPERFGTLALELPP